MAAPSGLASPFAAVAAEAALLGSIWTLKPCRAYAPSVTPMLLTITAIQLCEGLIWPDVVPLSVRLANDIRCPFNNTLLTSVIALLVICQPVFLFLIALRTPPGVSRAQHPSAQLIGFLTVNFTIYAVLVMGIVVYVLSSDPKQRPFDVDSNGKPLFPYDVAYATSCSYRGPHGHLLWQFAGATRYSDLLPNSFGYLYGVAAAILLFYDKVEATFVLGFTSLFLVLMLKYENWGEAASVWSWSGILLHILWTVFPVVKAQFNIPTVTSWSELLGCGRRYEELPQKRPLCLAQVAPSDH